MKPSPVIDEQWHARNSPGCTEDVYKDTEPRGYVFCGLVAAGEEGFAEAEARAKLAAAAPAMARLLLELEWSGSEWDYGGSDPCCPCCSARAPQTVHFPAKRIDAYTRVEAHDEVFGGKHDADCRLVALLRAAGVTL